jgi:hypothetical protein
VVYLVRIPTAERLGSGNYKVKVRRCVRDGQLYLLHVRSRNIEAIYLMKPRLISLFEEVNRPGVRYLNNVIPIIKRVRGADCLVSGGDSY